MDMRTLGASGIEIAPLMFGGNVFGWTADQTTSHRLLDAFVEGGFNAVDTADVYSAWVPGHEGGESERVIGDWLAKGGRRDRLVIATKVGMWPKRPGLKAANIEAACEESLQRLRTDHIDLYQSHQDDAETPIEETLSAFDRLIKAGKVRAVGASNFTAPRLAEALKLARDGGLPLYATLQPKYNLYDRDSFEGDLERVCRDNGVAVIPYYGLAAGFLTGKYRGEADLQGKARGRTVKAYLNDRGTRILAALDAAAASLSATPAQVALAWLMTKIAAPIASATSVAQLEELMGAARLRLPAEVLADLDRASGPA